MPSGYDAEPCLALALLLQMSEDVHTGGVPPEEKGLVPLLRFIHETERFLGDFLVNRFHALNVKRARGLDLLRAIRVRRAVNHATSAEFLLHFRILEVVGILRLLLRVEVVERAEELVEPVGGGQRLVGVAQVVLAELRGDVALVLEQLGDGHVARLQALPSRRAGRP